MSATEIINQFSLMGGRLLTFTINVVVGGTILALDILPPYDNIGLCNDQWRICFVWRGANVEQVEIVDYH
jgi:hypothetical protein